MQSSSANNYVFVDIIGRGSFGVAKLFTKKDGQLVVIKQISLAGLQEKERNEAMQECLVMQELAHPNIVCQHEFFIENDQLWIVMDYCEGGDLNSITEARNGNLFTEDEILDIFLQLALGLCHVHKRNIVHRDLKLQNIFLLCGIIKIGDFGIARLLANESDFARTLVGTPFYFSPEICQDRPYNTKSDMWQLGCILYEITTLRHAFTAQNVPSLILKIMKGTYPSIPSRYSDNLKKLISWLLSKNPDERPSAQQVIQMPYVTERIRKFVAQSGQLSGFLPEDIDLMPSLTNLKEKNLAKLREALKARRKEENASWMKKIEAEQQKLLAQGEGGAGALGRLDGEAKPTVKVVSVQDLLNALPDTSEWKQKHDMILKERQQKKEEKRKKEQVQSRVRHRQNTSKNQEEIDRLEQKRAEELEKMKRKQLLEERMKERETNKRESEQRIKDHMAQHAQRLKAAQARIARPLPRSQSLRGSEDEEDETVSVSRNVRQSQDAVDIIHELAVALQEEGAPVSAHESTSSVPASINVVAVPLIGVRIEQLRQRCEEVFGNDFLRVYNSCKSSADDEAELESLLPPSKKSGLRHVLQLLACEDEYYSQS